MCEAAAERWSVPALAVGTWVAGRKETFTVGCDAATRFRIASVTKPLTALLAVELLDLEAATGVWPDDVRVRHLLSHLSGFDCELPERDLSRHPLFQVMFALQNAPMEPPRLPGLTARLVELDSVTSPFDLTLLLEERAGGLHGLLEYATDLFDEPTMTRLIGHFETLLTAIPVEEANTLMYETTGPYALTEDPPVWAEYRRAIAVAGLGLQLKPIEKWAFYKAVSTADHVLTIQTADQQRFANLLLTIGVRM